MGTEWWLASWLAKGGILLIAIIIRRYTTHCSWICCEAHQSFVDLLVFVCWLWNQHQPNSGGKLSKLLYYIVKGGALARSHHLHCGGSLANPRHNSLSENESIWFLLEFGFTLETFLASRVCVFVIKMWINQKTKKQRENQLGALLRANRLTAFRQSHRQIR